MILQEIVLTATMGVVDILRLFKVLITKFAQACKNGWKGFKNFLEKILANKADDLVKEEGKVLDELEKELQGLSDSDLDWMASRKTGNLGGKVLKASQIRKLRGILKEKGILLIIEGDAKNITKLFKPVNINGTIYDKVDDLFFFMRGQKPPLDGGFDAVNKQFILPKKLMENGKLEFATTEIIVFHEMAHLKHFEEIGSSYKTLNELEKEMYVWKQIIENRDKWTKLELNEALRYINDIRTNPKYKLSEIKIN